MENINTNSQNIECAVRIILNTIGENPNREGLIDTPDRVNRMCTELFAGYDAKKKPNLKTFSFNGNSDMVIDKGEFYSLCEHHMLPFFGTYKIAYVPNDMVIGLSKIARCVRYCSARLQVQERLANNVLDMLSDALPNAKGWAIELRGMHMCKRMRGVMANGEMVTLLTRGVFENDSVKEMFINS